MRISPLSHSQNSQRNSRTVPSACPELAKGPSRRGVCLCEGCRWVTTRGAASTVARTAHQRPGEVDDSADLSYHGIGSSTLSSSALEQQKGG